MRFPIRVFTFLSVLLLTISVWARGGKGSVTFTNLGDKATVTSPLRLQFSVTGMTVKPAGQPEKGTGHHHLIINGGPIPTGTVIPADDKHLHFGGGQTEGEIKLPPGKHTLTLQFADGVHKSYGPDWSQTLSITVK